MGMTDCKKSVFRRGFALPYLVLLSGFIIAVNAGEDVISNCAVVSFDKAMFQGAYQIIPTNDCVIFKFENVPYGFDRSDPSGKNIFVTIYNVSVSPMFGVPDDESWYGYSSDAMSKKLSSPSKFCSCNMCAAPLDSAESLTNASATSFETRLWQSVTCLPALSAQGRNFRIPIGGRLLIVAKKQSPLYVYRLSYKYIYEVMCPSPLEESTHVLSAKAASWCSGSQHLIDGSVDDQHPLCISSQWQCDGFVDCQDSSDESCCPPQFTRCTAWQGLAGKCVRRCNGYSECQQSGTELDCRLPDCPEPNLSCRVPTADDTYGGDQSYQGGFQCLPASRRCNGLAECAEALDELGCDETSCGPENGTYLCEGDISGRCIRQDFVCDGQPHCPNADDENFCPILSRRLNVVLCMSGLFSCASVLFVIAYFHRRYCVVRRNRGRHRRRRFDLMSPVEQAARYFMQMCGAPPSYSQIMQMGGPGSEVERPGSSMTGPVEDQPSRPNLPATTTATVDVIAPPPPDREVSSGDDSSEAEYLSTLTFPVPSNSRTTSSSVQIHAPAFMLSQPIQRLNGHSQIRADCEQAEYAECADDPSTDSVPSSVSQPFAAVASDLSLSSDFSTNNIEMITTSSCSTLVENMSLDYAPSANESQTITTYRHRLSSDNS